jgi:hypothetical protein
MLVVLLFLLGTPSLDIRSTTIKQQTHSLLEVLNLARFHNETGQAEKVTTAARGGLVRQARLTWCRRRDMLSTFQPNFMQNRESMLVERKLHALLTESNWRPESSRVCLSAPCMDRAGGI